MDDIRTRRERTADKHTHQGHRRLRLLHSTGPGFWEALAAVIGTDHPEGYLFAHADLSRGARRAVLDLYYGAEHAEAVDALSAAEAIDLLSELDGWTTADGVPCIIAYPADPPEQGLPLCQIL